MVHLSGLAGMTDLGGVVEGTITDATHFVLDFPESTFITRYTRSGPTAQALISGRKVTVEPGAGTAGEISPEDLLPDQIWLRAIAPWQEALRQDATGSGYSADTAFLAGLAREHGLFATDWRLSVKTNVAGRVATVAFSGVTLDQAFELDLVMLYG